MYILISFLSEIQAEIALAAFFSFFFLVHAIHLVGMQVLETQQKDQSIRYMFPGTSPYHYYYHA
jgi:hypothetical protein